MDTPARTVVVDMGYIFLRQACIMHLYENIYYIIYIYYIIVYICADVYVHFIVYVYIHCIYSSNSNSSGSSYIVS